jgi:hypothetical protein
MLMMWGDNIKIFLSVMFVYDPCTFPFIDHCYMCCLPIIFMTRISICMHARDFFSLGMVIGFFLLNVCPNTHLEIMPWSLILITCWIEAHNLAIWVLEHGISECLTSLWVDMIFICRCVSSNYNESKISLISGNSSGRKKWRVIE